MAMTASVTRSRRVDGLQLSQHRLVPNAKAVPNSQQYAPINHPPRAKRPLDAPERDFDAVVAKRAKFTTGIAVEIPSRPPLHPSARPSREPDAKSSCPKPPAPTQSRAPPARTPSAAAAAAAAAAATAATHGNAQQQPTVTKHQEKVANGLKHELNKLQANAVDTKDQGRKLRSQEAHFKSELSSFFADYDEVIGNDPKEHRTQHTPPALSTAFALPPIADLFCARHCRYSEPRHPDRRHGRGEPPAAPRTRNISRAKLRRLALHGPDRLAAHRLQLPQQGNVARGPAPRRPLRAGAQEGRAAGAVDPQLGEGPRPARAGPDRAAAGRPAGAQLAARHGRERHHREPQEGVRARPRALHQGLPGHPREVPALGRRGEAPEAREGPRRRQRGAPGRAGGRRQRGEGKRKGARSRGRRQAQRPPREGGRRRA